MKKLKVFQVINETGRISSVDIFRSFAIISVVLFHFNHTLKYGYIGVDLFFVISGLLVGGLLTKEFKKGNKINFIKFFLQRGFKIWPSYYFFLAAGSIIVVVLYRNSNPGEIIPFWDLKRYLFFYQNFTGPPFHSCFDHVWSLCVEEHFYILLPILFLIVQGFLKDKHRLKALFIFVLLTILAGIIFKFLSYYCTHSKDTYSGTQNRIDALAWGVLLNLLISYYGEYLKTTWVRVLSLLIGALLFVVAVYYLANSNNVLFTEIYFRSILPTSFFLLLMGAYFVDFSKFKVLRLIAYYSYNWYLWHPIFVICIINYFGATITGLIVYVLLSFLVAVATTIFIEEPFLKRRSFILQKLFKNK